LDIVITNCNYLFASNGAQAWVEVDNSNFTKKVAASTGFVHPDGTLARAYTSSADRTLGSVAGSYFGATAVGYCNIRPQSRVVYFNTAHYSSGGYYCRTIGA
jgi:hypothetical protein